MCVCVSKGNLWESVISFQHVGPGDQTQFGRLAGKRLYRWAISPAHSVWGDGQVYKIKRKVPDSLIPKSVPNLQF